MKSWNEILSWVGMTLLDLSTQKCASRRWSSGLSCGQTSSRAIGLLQRVFYCSGLLKKTKKMHYRFWCPKSDPATALPRPCCSFLLFDLPGMLHRLLVGLPFPYTMRARDEGRFAPPYTMRARDEALPSLCP